MSKLQEKAKARNTSILSIGVTDASESIKFMTGGRIISRDNPVTYITLGLGRMRAHLEFVGSTEAEMLRAVKALEALRTRENPRIRAIEAAGKKKADKKR